MRVELDKRALFALASDTRLDILKSLQPMRRTVTQLADTLGIDKAAIHRHLKTLEEGGFVKRYEDHGFVYYGLSWKSRDILSPSDNTKVVLLLSASIAFIAVIVLIMTATFVEFGDNPVPMIPGDQDAEAPDDTYNEVAASELAVLPIMVAGIVICLLLATGLVTGRATRIMRRPRQPGMRPGD